MELGQFIPWNDYMLDSCFSDHSQVNHTTAHIVSTHSQSQSCRGETQKHSHQYIKHFFIYIDKQCKQTYFYFENLMLQYLINIFKNYTTPFFENCIASSKVMSGLNLAST